MFRVAVCICTCDRATLLARVLTVVEQIELRHAASGERPADRGRQSRRRARRGPCARRMLPGCRSRCALSRSTRRASRSRATGQRRRRWAGVPTSWRFWTTTTYRVRTGSGSSCAGKRETGADLVFGFWCLPSDLRLPHWLREHPLLPPARARATATGSACPAGPGPTTCSWRASVLDALSHGEGPFRAAVRPLRRRGQRSVHPRQGGRVPPCLCAISPSSCALGSRTG